MTKFVFYTGFAVFLAANLLMAGLPIFLRNAPVEPDDAYSYILKAAELESCFTQDCPALNDLRAQLVPDADLSDDVQLARYRQRHRLFSLYSPLHALILAGLQRMGLSWEWAYNTLQLVGAAFVALVVAIWLRVLWQPAQAGITLLILAATPFIGHGLDRIVPSSFALGIALITWTAILRGRRSSIWILLGILTMILMHPIGRLYAIVAIALCIVMPNIADRRWISEIGLLVLVVVFALPLAIAHPQLGLAHDPVPAGWTRAQGLHDTAARSAHVVVAWIGIDRRNLPAAPLILASLAAIFCVGFATVSSCRRRQIILMVAALVAIFPVDLIVPSPHYPAVVFERTFIPLAILLTGAIGQAAVFCARGLRRSTGFRDACMVLLAPAIVSYIGYTIPARWTRIQNRLTWAVRKNDVRLDPAQVSALLAQSQPGDRVLYTNETTMYFCLANGAFNLGAIYLPAIKGTEIEQKWLNDPNIRLVERK